MGIFCFTLFLCLVVGTVFAGDLKCDCNVCDENNTCTTDGLCYTETHFKNGEISYTYGCLNRQQFIPPEDIPFVCRDEKYGIQCCFRDNCNRDLLPALPSAGPDIKLLWPGAYTHFGAPKLANFLTRHLKCDCNVCNENTCITDGLCYTEKHEKDEEVSYTYGCLNRQQFIPPEDIPFVCRDQRYGVQCCFQDNCNRDLLPALPPGNRDAYSFVGPSVESDG